MPKPIEPRHRNVCCPACGSENVVARGSVWIRIGADSEVVAKGFEFELDDTALFACEDCGHQWHM